MAASVASGTQTATVGTEHTLHTSTLAKTFVLIVDTDNLANGDTLELRVKTKVLSTSTSRLAYAASFSHAQAAPVKLSIPVVSLHELVVTLKQTAGTGRSFDWNLVTLD